MTAQDATAAAAGSERTVRTTLQWAALLVLFLLGVIELLGGAGGLVGSSQAAPGPGRSSVEDLARRIGCTADITTDAADLRQGMCTSGGEEIWIATFPTERARDAWTSEAKAYGGRTSSARAGWSCCPTRRPTCCTDCSGGDRERGRPHRVALPYR